MEFISTLIADKQNFVFIIIALVIGIIVLRRAKRMILSAAFLIMWVLKILHYASVFDYLKIK